MSRRRRGMTLVEAVVGVFLGAMVVTLAVRTLLQTASVARDTLVRDDRLTARRIARLTLRSELSALASGEARSSGGDSLSVRAVRGAGRVCQTGADELVVDLQSVRSPEPGKDSVELIGPLGSLRTVDLIDSRVLPDGCGQIPAGKPTALRSAGHIPSETIFVRLFETGSYHLPDGALRYRRGEGGRQPLTPVVWDPSSSLHVDGSWIRVLLRRGGEDTRVEPILFRTW